MSYKEIILRDQNPQVELSLIESGIPVLAAKVLSSRGIGSVEEAKAFLDTGQNLISDPSGMADIDRAYKRIEEAIRLNQSICVYGDYDVDGISAVVLMVSWLRERKADVMYYIPDRSEGGYGLNIQALNHLKKKMVDLIITVDLGVTAVDEVEYANSIGVDIVVTDHHEPRSVLPAAHAVVNPCREDCPFPFKMLSGVGVVFMLLLYAEGMDKLDSLLKRYSDLVAIGTISDVMPLTGINRAIVWRGLEEINTDARIGLKTLIRESGPPASAVNSGFIGFNVAPRINAAGRMGRAREAADLLLTDNPAKAQKLAVRLCELNRTRQKTENEIYEAAVNEVEENIKQRKGKRGTIVLTSTEWHQGVIGIIASRLSERYACPAILIHIEDGIGKGSARSFYGVDILKAIQKVSHLFDTWGGHEFAVGFTIKEENIPGFRTQMEGMTCELQKAHINIDAEIGPEYLTPKFIRGLEILEPHGAENPVPAFRIEGMEVLEIVSLGWGKSLKIMLKTDGRTYPAFFFGMNMQRLDICEGDIITAICKVEMHEGKGSEFVKFILFDLRHDTEYYRRYKEEFQLYRRFEDGEEISREEALLLMPTKEEFIALLRFIRRNTLANKRISIRTGAMCRQICREEKLCLTFGKIMVSLNVLAEKKRLEYTSFRDLLEIEMLEDVPTNLNTAQMMVRLNSLIHREV